MRLTTALSLVFLVAFALTATGGTAAFAWAQTDRSVAASIVADGSAYNAVSMPACSVSGASGGTCTFDVLNKATVAQSFTITEAEDLGGAVLQFKIDSGGWSAGPLTSGEIAPPTGSIRITADIPSCSLCADKMVYWTVEGNKANVITTKETRVQMTVHYT